jgi:hypothetical protein
VLRESELATEGRTSITHINLASGETRPPKRIRCSRRDVARASESAESGGGLPLNPGADTSKPLDPQKVAAPGAELEAAPAGSLPALLANSQNQSRLLNESNDEKKTAA